MVAAELFEVGDTRLAMADEVRPRKAQNVVARQGLDSKVAGRTVMPRAGPKTGLNPRRRGVTVRQGYQPRSFLRVMCHAPGWSEKQGWIDLTARPDLRRVSRARCASQRFA